jgi:hypothetical protein
VGALSAGSSIGAGVLQDYPGTDGDGWHDGPELGILARGAAIPGAIDARGPRANTDSSDPDAYPADQRRAGAAKAWLLGDEPAGREPFFSVRPRVRPLPRAGAPLAALRARIHSGAERRRGRGAVAACECVLTPPSPRVRLLAPIVIPHPPMTQMPPGRPTSTPPRRTCPPRWPATPPTPSTPSCQRRSTSGASL